MPLPCNPVTVKQLCNLGPLPCNLMPLPCNLVPLPCILEPLSFHLEPLPCNLHMLLGGVSPVQHHSQDLFLVSAYRLGHSLVPLYNSLDLSLVALL